MSWQTYGLILLAIGSVLMGFCFHRDSKPAQDEDEPYGDASMYGRE